MQGDDYTDCQHNVNDTATLLDDCQHNVNDTATLLDDCGFTVYPEKPVRIHSGDCVPGFLLKFTQYDCKIDPPEGRETSQLVHLTAL